MNTNNSPLQFTCNAYVRCYLETLKIKSERVFLTTNSEIRQNVTSMQIFFSGLKIFDKYFSLGWKYLTNIFLLVDNSWQIFLSGLRIFDKYFSLGWEYMTNMSPACQCPWITVSACKILNLYQTSMFSKIILRGLPHLLENVNGRG